MQGIFPLAVANVGIRLTTAKWYTPGGHAISGAGIKPDVAVQTALKPEGGAAAQPVADAILAAGMQAARSQVATQPVSRRP